MFAKHHCLWSVTLKSWFDAWPLRSQSFESQPIGRVILSPPDLVHRAKQFRSGATIIAAIHFSWKISNLFPYFVVEICMHCGVFLLCAFDSFSPNVLILRGRASRIVGTQTRRFQLRQVFTKGLPSVLPPCCDPPQKQLPFAANAFRKSCLSFSSAI